MRSRYDTACAEPYKQPRASLGGEQLPRAKADAGDGQRGTPGHDGSRPRLRAPQTTPHRGASDLYAEQGIGVAFNTFDLGGAYVYWVKIEEEGAGSKVTVYTGNNLAKQKYVDDMFRWASGDTKCTKGWII